MIGWLLARAWPLAAALGVAMLGVIGVQAYTIRGMKLEAASSLLKATQAARAKEQQAAIDQGVIVDALLQKQASLGLERDAIASRLRKLSASRSQAAASCSQLDEPTAGIVHERFREAALDQAKRADEVANQLKAAQDWIRAAEKACSSK